MGVELILTAKFPDGALLSWPHWTPYDGFTVYVNQIRIQNPILCRLITNDDSLVGAPIGRIAL